MPSAVHLTTCISTRIPAARILCARICCFYLCFNGLDNIQLESLYINYPHMSNPRRCLSVGNHQFNAVAPDCEQDCEQASHLPISMLEEQSLQNGPTSSPGSSVRCSAPAPPSVSSPPGSDGEETEGGAGSVNNSVGRQGGRRRQGASTTANGGRQWCAVDGRQRR